MKKQLLLLAQSPNIRLYFISDPYQHKKYPQRQKINTRGLKLDVLLGINIPKFFGKHLVIQHYLPDPTILKCKA